MSEASLPNSALGAGGISYEPFLRETPAGSHLEWVEGKVVKMTPVCNAHAELAIEIISPDSQTIDRGEKFYEYEKGGVKEYWILAPPNANAPSFITSTTKGSTPPCP